MSAISSPSDGRLRVLHLVPSIGRRSGGGGIVAINLVREQNRLAATAVAWTLDQAAEAAEIGRAYELGNCIKTFPTLGPATVGLSPAMEREVVSALGESQQVIHQHSIWMANSRVTNLWRRRFQRPTIVAPQGTLEEYALKRSPLKKKLAQLAYETENLQSASCLHATCADEAVSFRRFGLSNPIALIPNGVPEDWVLSHGDSVRFRTQFAIPLDRRVLLFLSRIHPKKGLPMFFQAMSTLRQQQQFNNWLFVIAGPDEVGHRRELEVLSLNLGIENLIRFVGPLFGKEKRDAFAAADVFVLPTFSENFGIVVTEALGAGVPVITTRGAPWLELETNRCGWWVDTNPTAMQDAVLDAMARSKDELKAMGLRGQQLVSEKYTWPQIARRCLELYSWLLGQASRPDFVIFD